MKRILLWVSSLLLMQYATGQDDFSNHFVDKTLRLDYTLSGNNREQHIFLEEKMQSPGWYGRRVNLDRLLLRGNGQLFVTDTLGLDTLYCQSFSTLFQEWQTYEEATKLNRSFQNCFLIPMPRHPVNITLQLTDTHHRVQASMTHRVRPDDILIRRIGERCLLPWRYVRKNGDSKINIDIAFVAEGYKVEEMDVFFRDCEIVVEAMMEHEPFYSEASKFNFVAVASPSKESGITIPHKGLWVNTALASHYDTFYSDRYLTTSHLRTLHDLLAGIPYEHIIILANTENYGGGGIYNSYMMTSVHNAKSRPVAVHEFGHSFAGLGDEYFYDDMFETFYPSDTEPWEPNLTTLVDFASKWRDMLSANTKIPTKADNIEVYTKVGVYEGGGYQSKGVFRPSQECRMKINEAPVFCPVCQRAIRRIINYQTSPIRVREK